MPLLVAVKYHNRSYPPNVPVRYYEVPGHLDVETIDPPGPYILHTEYSYATREFKSHLISKYPILAEASTNRVPTLWVSKRWAVAYAGFIIDLVGAGPQPYAIEVHPPFKDYSNLRHFTSTLSAFLDLIQEALPQTCVVLHNRHASFRGGRKAFLVSTVEDILQISAGIDLGVLRLRLLIDFPQLLWSHEIRSDSPSASSHMEYLFSALKDVRHNILGIHLWGRKRNTRGTFVPHSGDLNTLFDGDQELKEKFLLGLSDLLDDGSTRYFVPEVANDHELSSIVKDLFDAGFQFV